MQRLTQHFEHMSLRNVSNSLDYGSLLDDPTGEAAQIQLNHDAVSWESYSAQVFPTLDLVQSSERHHGTELQVRALGSQFKTSSGLSIKKLSSLQRLRANQRRSCTSRSIVGKGARLEPDWIMRQH